MILRSVRLKNIKSYGQGAAGNGVTVTFQPGLNCVAGRNGHGKTTLIEAIGFALFDSKPDCEERFTLPTYFVRAGEKEGEIDVVFEHEGETYRVERDVGQSRRRSKIVQLSDNSTCAEDDEPVGRFLSKLFLFKEPKELAELFSNLIGVKQGRLAWPFDSKPGAAKEFFEPLLNVAIFRESAAGVADAQTRFKDELARRGTDLGALEERLRERADSADKVQAKVTEVEDRRKALSRSRARKLEADQSRDAWEKRQSAFDAAKSAADQAQHQLALASHQHASEQRRLKDSEEALAAFKQAEPAYHAYVQAEERLRVLGRQQSEKAALERQRAEAVNLRTRLEAKIDAARQQAGQFAGDREQRAKLADVLREQLAQGRKALDDSQSEFTRREQTTAAAKRSRDALEGWLENLATEVAANQRLGTELVAVWEQTRLWDPQAAARARDEEPRLAAAAEELDRNLARAQQAEASLAEQLRQIQGGVCPFLKEKCRQFDPKAIEADLGARERELAQLQTQHAESVAAHRTAKAAAEKLRSQETGIAQLKKSVAEKARGLVERHQRLFPVAVQKHLTLVQEYLAGRSSQRLELAACTASVSWVDAEALDTQRLNEVVAAEAGFLQAASEWVRQASPALDQQFAEFDRQRNERVRQERDQDHSRKDREKAEREEREFSVKLEQSLREAKEAETQAQTAAGQAAELEERLKAFAGLERELAEQHALKDRHAPAHRAYLGAKPLADRLDERREAVRQSAAAEARARTEAQQKADTFAAASRQFDPAALERARNEAAAADKELEVKARDLRIAETELEEQRRRLEEWKAACAQRDAVEGDIARLEAAGELAKLAAKVLRSAAPAVAQHICNRIAASAQRLFNQIHHEPIELEWKAEPQYSLRVFPGERRFAMLSGGEQTKLAVAMTLAMIDEFSDLGFAVFDEPTYAVDAESRPKLADAILTAQKAADLDQLIVVSHDDSFEGKLDHVILVRKVAGTGTEVIQTSA